MQCSHRTLPALPLMGLYAQTTNTLEGTPGEGKIGPLIHRYYAEKIADQLPTPVSPGISYSLYTDYESDFHGPYTYLFGEEVPEDSLVPPGASLTLCTVPAQTYALFTVGPGPMPTLVVNAWQAIWKMTEKDFGGRRLYLGDFERYDERASNPEQAIVDIYVGIAS